LNQARLDVNEIGQIARKWTVTKLIARADAFFKQRVQPNLGIESRSTCFVPVLDAKTPYLC
jgi:hypothetical protein